MSDHEIRHTHEHTHTIDHPDAFGHRVSSDPHTHEHGHTSPRETFNVSGGLHRNHFHTPENQPKIHPYRHSTGILKETHGTP